MPLPPIKRPHWKHAVAAPPPAEGEVHVWRLNLKQLPKLFLLELPGVDALERKHALKYRDPADGTRYGGGRCALRYLAGQYLNVAAEKLQFTQNAHGRPELTAAHSQLKFNLSHSGEWVLLAFTTGSELGVDLESTKSVRDFEGLAGRYFSPEECGYLYGLPSEQRPEAFFQIWTLKESYLKAAGTGLSGGLGGFSVLTESDDPENPASRFYLESFLLPGTSYVAALAIDGKPTHQEFLSLPGNVFA